MRDIFDVFEELGIAYENHEHPAVHTVEEASKHIAAIPGLHTKNLFLRNEKGNKHYLAVIESSKRADLKKIAELVGEKKLSFASPERLEQYLGVKPGSVSPFGLIHDTEHVVTVLIDNDLIAAEQVSFHPNRNTATTVVSSADFRTFLSWTRNDVRFADL